MKDKILKEVLDWCKNNEDKPNFYIEDFVDVVINKTTDVVFEEIKNELKNEFENGNLKHPFIISDEYYIYLKLKDIKNKLINPEKDSDYIENEETVTQKQKND
ncbi:MAG: hypothetical protein DRM99_03105 [Thermoplasmata archaeon]|nr:MAG: hypothetical protein FE039_01125 [Thermoplasmata archaeon]RLF36254.1 MAG: hypothetical protein DRM99_03105 [Thermoplasmata archaeon]RLF53400.1 MAG: hypothetical protein DRN24_01100 [Thermoplasmata archaeon]